MPVRTLTVLMVITALVAGIAMMPRPFASNATSAAEKNVDRGLPNFDIRSDLDSRSAQVLSDLRASVGKDAWAVRAIRDEIVSGEASLRTRMPKVVVEYNDRL